MQGRPGKRIIVVGNEKGGSGKSTTAMHLVVGLMRLGWSVGSIDVDSRQRTLTRYVENRAAFSSGRGLDLPHPEHRLIPYSEEEARSLRESDPRAREWMAVVDQVRAKGFTPEPLPEFGKLSGEELIAGLGSASHRRRREAQRELLGRELSQGDLRRIKGVAADTGRKLETRVAALEARDELAGLIGPLGLDGDLLAAVVRELRHRRHVPREHGVRHGLPGEQQLDPAGRRRPGPPPGGRPRQAGGGS